MSRKRKNNHDSAGSLDANDTYFGRVYPGLMQSPAFCKLPLSARFFYCVCRAQANSKQGRAVLYSHANTYGRTYPDGAFVFPQGHMEQFGFDGGYGRRCMQILIKAGFVEAIEQNHRQHIVNVFKFSDRWKST